MNVWSSTFTNAGEVYTALVHRLAPIIEPPTRPGVVFLPGGGEPGSYLREPARWGGAPPQIAEAGFPCISITNSVGRWGNDAMSALGGTIDVLVAYAVAHWGFPNAPVHLMGFSMGGINAANWSRWQPAKVRSRTFFCPGVNLPHIYADLPQFDAAIDAAYVDHAGYLAALPTHDPTTAANLAADAALKIPTRVYSSTDDPLVRPADQSAYAVGIGAQEISMGAVGHTAPTGSVNVADVLAFLVGNS